ncbi:MAG: hypothetical protein DHS20C12_00840 [Pseudohongiella sp.]|nr:MAG: hypothetical protein DHS20C12_00840 [Pseudohongiella sp.]
MTTSRSNRKLIRDFTILLTLAVLLVGLPLAGDYWLGSSMKPGSSEEPHSGSGVESTLAASLQQDQDFISEVFPKVSSWKAAELEPYLAEETKAGTWDSQVQNVLATLSERLGDLQYFGKPVPLVIDDTTSYSEGSELSVYEFVAYYEEGAADISLVLAEDSGEEALYSFNIAVQNESRTLQDL